MERGGLGRCVPRESVAFVLGAILPRWNRLMQVVRHKKKLDGVSVAELGASELEDMDAHLSEACPSKNYSASFWTSNF